MATTAAMSHHGLTCAACGRTFAMTQQIAHNARSRTTARTVFEPLAFLLLFPVVTWAPLAAAVPVGSVDPEERAECLRCILIDLL